MLSPRITRLYRGKQRQTARSFPKCNQEHTMIGPISPQDYILNFYSKKNTRGLMSYVSLSFVLGKLISERSPMTQFDWPTFKTYSAYALFEC